MTCNVQPVFAARFRCASAVQSVVDRRPHPCGCATGPKAGVVVDGNVGCDVQGIGQAQALLDAAFAQAVLYLWRDINECTPPRYVEPQFLAITLHRFLLTRSLTEYTERTGEQGWINFSL